MFYSQMLIKYLGRQLIAQNRHGLHSPFVYRLVDEVIYDFKTQLIYSELRQRRKVLLKQHGALRLLKTRLLAGFSSKETSPPRVDELIYRLTKYFLPNQIIQLGICSPSEMEYTRAAVPQAKVIRVNPVQEDAMFEVLKGCESIDLIKINQVADPQAMNQYLMQCLPQLAENSMVLFNHLPSVPGVRNCWNQIQQHPEFTVTIDLFWIGLAFARPGQVKQHFNIRFW